MTEIRQAKRLPDSGLIEIQINKATLFLHESELLNGLDREIFKRGLERGKAILRRRQYEKRQAEKQK